MVTPNSWLQKRPITNRWVGWGRGDLWRWPREAHYLKVPLPDLCVWCFRRFIFNWAHWAVGSVTEILAGWFHSRGLMTLLEGFWNVGSLRLCSARQWQPCSWGSVSRPSCSPSPGPPTFWLATWSGWPYSGSSSSWKSTFMPKVVRTQPNNNLLEQGSYRAALPFWA